MANLEHIAIIMDGNGRWAKKQKQKRLFGHYKGSEHVRTIALQALELKIKVLTLYAFSTENWKRPLEEVEYLMQLPEIFFNRFLEELTEKGISIRTIGNLEKIPAKTRKVIEHAVAKTAHNSKLILNFALNYGSRDEIVRTFEKIQNAGITTITEATISENLDTVGLPEVDLLIRTGGEQRLSNFLLWQLAYAEFVFLEVAWPEFSAEEFAACVHDYKQRQRRFGGLVE